MSKVETGEMTSYAVLVEGVDTLLPEVDFIVFCAEEQEGEQEPWSSRVPWAIAFELAAECFELDDTLTPA